MTPFGWPVEPEVNRNFAIVSGPTSAWAASTAGVGVGASSSAKASRAGRAADAATHNLDARRHGGGKARAKAVPFAAKTRPGVRMSKMALSLPKSCRHQRIGQRDRRIGNAHMHGGEAEQRMLDVVAGENRDRPLGRQPALRAARTRAPHRREGRPLGECARRPGLALREEDGARRRPGPCSAARSSLRVGRQRCGERTRWRRRRGVRPRCPRGPS